MFCVKFCLQHFQVIVVVLALEVVGACCGPNKGMVNAVPDA
jgi:hypothetical protein